MDYKELKNKLFETSKEFREEYLKRDLALEISDLIVKARIKAGLTQSELADSVGTKQSGIARAEGGSVIPSITLLDKIANSLKLTLVIDFKESSNTTSIGWRKTRSGEIISPYIKVVPINQVKEQHSKFKIVLAR